MLVVNEHGKLTRTRKVTPGEWFELFRKNFDLTPRGIIKTLDLLRPIYRKTACYGHFGRNGDQFTWEKTDKAADIAKEF